ncbi:MAG: glucose 1-dehydrogenase [Chloroflexota bacterium]
MGLLDDKVAIVTGGASGIGAASVDTFVEQGASVVIADIQDDKGDAIAQKLGKKTVYQHCDVTNEEDIKALVEKAVETFGHLDVLFNNAGIPGPTGGIADTPTDAADKAISVLLRSVILGMKYAAPIMSEQQSGSIINTASVAGIEATHAPHVYSAAKAGVINLTRSVAIELGLSFVRVNAICPGGIVTPIFGRTFGMDAEQADKTMGVMSEVLKTAQPIPRAGLPEDIAQTAVFLASDMSTFITGQAIAVDGGLTAGRANWDQSERVGQRIAQALFSAANS